MSRAIRCAVLVCTLVVLPALARAADGAWRVIASDGQVEMSNPAGAFVPAALSADIVPGTVLRTGANGRAVIENNGDKITLAPDSVFTLPVQQAGVMEHVKQTMGTALYDMVPRGVDRFRVDTPYLAAVIKGTVFTVNVTPEGGAVEVLRGVVQVTDGAGQFPTLVYPGQTATVAAANRGSGGVHLLGRPPVSAPNGASGAASTAPKPTNTTADAATPPAPANGFKIEHTIAPHAVAIGDLTGGLITKVDMARKKRSAGPNAHGAAGGGASAANSTGEGSGAGMVQTALADPDSADSAAASIVSQTSDSASTVGNGNGNGNNGNGNGNGGVGNAVSSAASSIVSGVSSTASTVVESASISLAGVTVTSANGNANGNNGNANGTGNGNGGGNGQGNNGNGNGNGGSVASVVAAVTTTATNVTPSVASTVSNLVNTVTSGNNGNGNGNGNAKGKK